MFEVDFETTNIFGVVVFDFAAAFDLMAGGVVSVESGRLVTSVEQCKSVEDDVVGVGPKIPKLRTRLG